MKKTQDNNKLGHRPSLAVVVVILTCVGCFLQVQWTLYTHRVQIDDLVKHIMKQHQPQSSGTEGVFLRRVKRSQNTQQFPGKNTKSTPNSQINTELIRNAVSKQLQHLLKTRICANNNKMCIRGLRGRRGMRGRTGSQGRRGPPGPLGRRGSVGKHGPVGPPCKKCNITVDSIKALIDTFGPQGLPDLRGPPGVKGEKGEHGKEVSAASISMPPKSVVVNESDMVSLYCGAKGFPAPRITWQKVNSSSPLSGPRHVVDVNGGLLIRNVKKSDQGTYKCTAKNIFPGEATAYATVTVQDAAKILQNQPAPIITEEGQNVTFTCAASGTPTPTITWSKVLSDGRYDIPQLLSDDRYEISQQIMKNKEDGMMWKDKVKSSNLTLINLSLDDNGLYICKADNKLNSDTTMTQLTVVKPLYFTVIPPSKLEVFVGKTVQIDCEAINAAGQTWVQPTQDATNVNVFSNGSLVIIMATKQNEGIYKCTARSQYRQISAVTYVSAIYDYHDCKEKPLGMESGAIPDSSITASSIFSAGYATSNARLNGHAAWAATTTSVGEWIQVDLLKVTYVTVVATQGSRISTEWVTSYSLQYSVDGKSFTDYQSGKTFNGNSNTDTVVKHSLQPCRHEVHRGCPIYARYIKLFPKTWYGYPSMRMELYGCK